MTFQDSAFAVLPHRLHFTPIFLCFWVVSAVTTYAVIPAENTCSLSAVYWPFLVIIYTRNGLITCNMILIIPGILRVQVQ